MSLLCSNDHFVLRADLGETPNPLSSPLSNGSIGSITGASSNPSETSHQRKLRQTSTPHWNNRPWPHNFNQMASGVSGAVHNVFVVRSVVPEVPLMTIYRGVMPFLLAMIVALMLIIIFPQIALLIPDSMFGAS